MCIPMQNDTEQKAPLSPDGGEPLLINQQNRPHAPEGYKIAFIDGIWQVVSEGGQSISTPFGNLMAGSGRGSGSMSGGGSGGSGGPGGGGSSGGK